MNSNSTVRKLYLLVLLLSSLSTVFADSEQLEMKLPDTGISGVYEVMVGTYNPETLIKYFAEFGYKVVKKAEFSSEHAKKLYGVASPLTSYRLQNGSIDTHGLLRILHWHKPLGNGVGYAQPETIGQRLSVMRTADIIRLDDIFNDARKKGEKWLPIKPIFADLYGQTNANPGVIERRVGVRESGIYGETFNHVFFQRYGYQIPGYGTINTDAPLQTSEFTHHDFIIKGDIDKVTNYYSKVLGLKMESPSAIDGDWEDGPKAVFNMAPGASHRYIGFVSPNNICGKLKFFVPLDASPDRSESQRPGELGITLHSFYSPKLTSLHKNIKDYGLNPTQILTNEFNEQSFNFTGPDGATWQIIEDLAKTNVPIKALNFELTNN